MITSVVPLPVVKNAVTSVMHGRCKTLTAAVVDSRVLTNQIIPTRETSSEPFLLVQPTPPNAKRPRLNLCGPQTIPST